MLKEQISSNYKVKQLESQIKLLSQIETDFEVLKGKHLYPTQTLTEQELKIKKELETFKELNADLEQCLKAATKETSNDKKQIQLLENKIERTEKEIDDYDQKYRALNKQFNDKLENEMLAHSHTKNELR